MNRKMNFGKRVIGTLWLPVLMYTIMIIISYSNGKMYYGTWNMWRPLMTNIAIATTMALGIGLQFNNGRFDFSGGAVMLLAAIISGNIAVEYGNNLVLYSVLCVSISTLLSVGVALLYVYGRLPVAITTITMALMYEAITPLLFNGRGISLIAKLNFLKVTNYPGVLVPLVLAMLVYTIYKNYTLSGKQSLLLAKNQSAAVDIGINENKNVIISYVFSGVLFGLATIIWAPPTIKSASFSSLSTVGALFTNILPVFIGLALSKYCGEAIGTVMGAITLSLMSYGLQAVLSNEMGAAVTMAFTGLFVFVFNIITTPYGSRISEWYNTWKRRRSIKKAII